MLSSRKIDLSNRKALEPAQLLGLFSGLFFHQKMVGISQSLIKFQHSILITKHSQAPQKILTESKLQFILLFLVSLSSCYLVRTLPFA